MKLIALETSSEANRVTDNESEMNLDTGKESDFYSRLIKINEEPRTLTDYPGNGITMNRSE